MSNISLSEFADKVGEIMPYMAKELFKNQSTEFHKLRITLSQFAILDFLARRGKSKMTDIAHFLNVTTAAMTGITDRLVRDGYIIRVNDPEDRRVVKVELKSKGTSVVRKMRGRKREMIIKVFGMISQKERDQYLNILMHIKEHLEKE